MVFNGFTNWTRIKMDEKEGIVENKLSNFKRNQQINYNIPKFEKFNYFLMYPWRKKILRKRKTA